MEHGVTPGSSPDISGGDVRCSQKQQLSSKDQAALQVLSQAEAAPPGSDSWLGNTLIDPSLGKQACERPDQRLGRPNLFPLMQQVRTY